MDLNKMHLNCPNCSQEMKPETCGNVTIDICPSCLGVWFDQNELQPVVEHLVTKLDIPQPQPKLFQPVKPAVTQFKIKEKQKYCPSCADVMDKFNYGFDSNIILDRCPKCSGVWADKGELRKMVEHAKPHAGTDAIATEIAEREGGLGEMGKLERTMRANQMGSDVLPIDTDIPVSRIPWATILLIGACIMVYLYQIFFRHDPRVFLRDPQFLSPFWGIGMIVPVFVHQNIVHLIANMFFLWVFGRNVEERVGPLLFTALFVVCGVMGNALQALVYPGLFGAAIGASGAISGIMGCYMAFFPKGRINLGVGSIFYYNMFWISAQFYLGAWFFMQVLKGILFEDLTDIGFWAHVGGFSCGFLCALVIKYCGASRKAA